MEGKLVGDIQKYGLASGAAALAPFHGMVSDEIAAQVEQIRKDIISGKAEIPRISVPPAR